MNYINKIIDGKKISRIGLGAMRMNDLRKATEIIDAAIDHGINYLNTGDFYGHGESEMVIREVLKTHKREDVFISVKFGGMLTPSGQFYGIDVRPQAVQNYLAYTLKRLGTDYVDLYQPARINPHIPVEDTIGAVADMVKAGYVRNIGITEVDAHTLRIANATHSIAMVELGYSLLNRQIEEELIPTARELGIEIVAFANLFHGIIGGRNRDIKVSELSKRMNPEAAILFRKAVSRLDGLQSLAEEKHISVSQLAIAWVLAKGNDLVDLVGASSVNQLTEILQALDVNLNDNDLMQIDDIVPKQFACNTAMLNIDLDENGMFKF